MEDFKLNSNDMIKDGTILWSLILLLTISISPVQAQNTFEERAAAITDQYATTVVPGDIPKYGFWFAQANFLKGKDADGINVLNQTYAEIPGDSPFAYWSAMDTYLRWKNTKYDQPLTDRSKEYFTTFTDYKGGFSQNHRVMLAVARFLASEQWPETDFVPGSEYQTSDPTGRDFLIRKMKEWIYTGVIEHDSPIYIAFHLGPMRTLADLSQDPEIKQLAAWAFEWLMINSANNWMEGHMATSSLRNLFPYDAQNEYYESDFMHWLYFGGKNQTNFDLGGLPRACFALGLITSDYQLPQIITDIANTRTNTFTNLESHAVNDAWSLEFRKTTFMDKDLYAVYSQAELPSGQNSGLNEQSHRWGVVWQSINDDQKSTFWFKHGRKDISKNKAGTTKYEQVVQKDRTLAAVYDIPADDGFPFVEGFVSPDLSVFIDTPNKVYFHYGNVLIAVLSPKPISWDPSDPRIKLDHIITGAVVETALPTRYEGTPAQQLEAFKAEIESFDRLEGSSVEVSPPRIVYQSIYGNELDIKYEAHRKVNGNQIDYTAWPLMSNPWVEQDVNGNILTLNINGSSRVYDFAGRTVIDGPGSSLVAPANLTATTISSNEIQLTWEDPNTIEEGFKLERKSAEGAYAEVATLESDITTYKDSSLISNTLYSYRIRTFKEVQNSFYSNPASATTLKKKPVAADSLEIEQIFFDRVDLKWRDNSDNEDGFKVERKGKLGDFEVIAELDKDAVYFSDTSLTHSGYYTYRIVAFNNGGETVSGEENIYYQRWIRNLQLDHSCSNDPDYERRWSVYNPNPFQVVADWKTLYRKQSGDLIVPSGTSYFFTTTEDILNVVKLIWEDDKGRTHKRINYSRGTQCDLQVPETPVNPDIKPISISQLLVTWEDASDTENSFKVERKNEDGDFEQVGVVPANETSFLDNGLDENNAYTYRVRAFNAINGHSPYAVEVSDTTLSKLAYYKFDDNVEDALGNYPGENKGVGFVLGGLIDQAASFNGIDQYVNIPTGIFGSDKGSVSMWVKTTQSSRGMLFYGAAQKGNGFGPEQELHLNITNDGEIEFYHEGAEGLRLTANRIDDDQWHHIVATWDVEDVVKLYVDGIEKRSAPHDGNPFVFSDKLRFGRSGKNERYFDGLMDEVKLYNSVLAASDVQNLFADGDNPIQIAILSPVEGPAYLLGQTLTIEVEATHETSTIETVAFYVADSLLGEVNNAPYVFDLILEEAGEYVISAIATANDGASAGVGPVRFLVVEADGEIYQAEEGFIFNGAIETEHSNYLGTAYVNNDNEAGSYTEWTVNAEQSGDYVLNFRFANGSSSDRPVEIMINDIITGSLTGNSTGAWSVWEIATMNAILNAGENKIRVTGITSGGGPNLDALFVVNSVLNNLLKPENHLKIAENQISLYPNPASSELHLRFPEKGIWNIAITDITGRNMLQKLNYADSNKQLVLINVEEFNEGLYLIQLTRSDKKYFYKLIIER